MKEERIGIVSHYYTHLGVAAVVLEGELAVGDTIHIKGHTSDFTQKVESIQIEHRDVTLAKNGDNVGIRVKEHAREHDVVYKVVEG
ncbi:MAG: translation elongation factor-like protein [Deltaproteobacteria bacterium]|nr:translation elongation factor-like protein [Deltaproteobacteria bacterium]